MELTRLLIYAFNILVAACSSKCPYVQQHDKSALSIQTNSLIKSTYTHQRNDDYHDVNNEKVVDYRLVKLDILDLLKNSKSFWPAGFFMSY